MPQGLPAIGAEVLQAPPPAAAASGLPPIGAEVPASMPHFQTSNEFGPDGKPLIRSVTDYAKEATAGLNPVSINHAIQSAFWHPIDTARGVVAAQDVPRQKAMQAFERGDYLEGVRHAFDWLIPFMGPRIDQGTDWIQQGEYAKGAGALTDVGLQAAVPKVAGAVTARVPAIVAGTKNAVQRAAVSFGRAEGIPLDAGTATGSSFIKNVQKKVGSTWGGASTAETAQANQAAALARTGEKLAGEANATPAGPGAPVTPVSAGESVADALKTKIRDFDTTATTSYDGLRAMETADPSRFRVNLAATKTRLRPIYDRLMRESQIAPPQGGGARALMALDRLMNGPDVAPLSEVDAALSDLKALARGADMPELRTSGQGIAAEVVHQLDTQVRGTASRAGPGALQALEAGRAATKAKYGVSEVLDLVTKGSTEPRGIFNRLTAAKDTGLTKLRELHRVAPEQIPEVARALMEELLDKPTSEGGFRFADKAQADWRRIGDATKRILFPKAGQIEALDNFFQLAKKIGENPNPSGTAQTLNATNVIAGIPAYALAKMLYTPGGVKLLTTALRVSVNAAPATRAMAMAQVVRAAQEAGVPWVLPKAADQETGQK